MVTETDAHWAVGLVDGEGCFSFYVGVTPRGYFNVNYGLIVHLRADDRKVLQELSRVLDCGIITDVPGLGSRNPSCRWHASGRQNGLKLVDFFDTYPLRSKKKRDFELWKEGVRLHQKFKHGNNVLPHNQQYHAPLMAIKTQLETGRRYSV